jgi:nucleoside-diphosphate-sugar epimerase
MLTAVVVTFDIFRRGPRWPLVAPGYSGQPSSLYAATKGADEAIAKVYNHLYGIRSAGLRFNLFLFFLFHTSKMYTLFDTYDV